MREREREKGGREGGGEVRGDGRESTVDEDEKEGGEWVVKNMKAREGCIVDKNVGRGKSGCLH